jgi:glycosyltransferase involved in cell wall biosynthesis
MSATPRVSVCLLAYNHAKVIGDAIQSVLDQTFTDFELIVSDDRSPDATWSVIQSWAERDARVRPIQTPRNLGMAGNSNYAVAQSSAPYIALLHHDDIYAPTLLQRWLEVMERYPDVAFVSNAYATYNDPRVDYHHFDEHNDGPTLLRRRLLPTWGCPVRGTAMIRRSSWEAVGGMRLQFGMLADVDLWMRLAASGAVGYVAEPLITVRQERPEDYPAAYWQWSWERLRLLYEIHAENWHSTYSDDSWYARSKLAQFRLRLNANTLYWLTYAVAKRRAGMLASSEAVATPYELGPVRWLRHGLASIASRGTRDHA